MLHFPSGLAAGPFADLEDQKNLTPEALLKSFAGYTYELGEQVQDAETFLQRKRGDCDDFASLAETLLTKRGYHAKLVVIMMARETHVVCYVKEAGGFLDFNFRNDAKPIIESDGSLNRALEKLELLLRRRGITTTSAALSAVLIANAVQAAPASLLLNISTAAGVATTSIATATKAIAMTTLQKTVVGIALAAAIGTSVYEVCRNSILGNQIKREQQDRANLTGQMEQLRHEHSDLNLQLAALRAENERLNRNTPELLKLRGEVGGLRKQTNAFAALRDEYMELKTNSPIAAIPSSLSEDLSFSKHLYVEVWMRAILAYAHDHGGVCPESFQQVQPYLPDNIRQIAQTADQFELLYQGDLDDVKDREIIVFREKRL